MTSSSEWPLTDNLKSTPYTVSTYLWSPNFGPLRSTIRPAEKLLVHGEPTPSLMEKLLVYGDPIPSLMEKLLVYDDPTPSLMEKLLIYSDPAPL